MKNLSVLFLLGIFCFACEKDEDNPKFENVDIINSIDFTLMPTSDPAEPTKDSFNLDIDHDMIPDITFFVYSYSLGHESRYNSKIAVLNNYEIAIQKSYKYDAGNANPDLIFRVEDSVLVDIPKICNHSDTISDQLAYVSAPVDLAYSRYESYQMYTSLKYISDWNDIGDKYIGLRNKTDKVFCWVKISVSDHSKIALKSFSYSIDEDLLVILE